MCLFNYTVSKMEIEIKLSSMRITMEQTNAAYNEWISDECDKRIQVHLASNNELKASISKLIAGCYKI